MQKFTYRLDADGVTFQCNVEEIPVALRLSLEHCGAKLLKEKAKCLGSYSTPGFYLFQTDREIEPDGVGETLKNILGEKVKCHKINSDITMF
jgi:hypothetical protein